jgi:hypothetical protein
LTAKYERVKTKLPNAKIHGKSMVFLLNETNTERRRRKYISYKTKIFQNIIPKSILVRFG